MDIIDFCKKFKNLQVKMTVGPFCKKFSIPPHSTDGSFVIAPCRLRTFSSMQTQEVFKCVF